MNDEKISFADVLIAEKKRRAIDSPWTAEDEARASAKSKAEHDRQEAWDKTHPQDEEEEDDDDDDDDENEA
jgi:hypothetical protein